MCRFAQEAADGHCRTFGMSLPELREQNKMWILTRLRLVMNRYPNHRDAVRVETWASSRTNGIRAFREFQFFDESGMALGRAISIWLMLDISTKRAVRLPQIILDICNPERTDPDEFEIPRLTAPENASNGRIFEVGWKDLDQNNHLNNVNYVQWALEALPLEINRDRIMAQMDIEFLAEAFYGDQVTSEVEVSGLCCSHVLRKAEGSALALLKTNWR